MADYRLPSRTIKDAMKSGKGLWESDIHYGLMPENIRVVFQKGVLNYINVPLVLSQQKMKAARLVNKNRGTGSGTRWDRHSKAPSRRVIYAMNPQNREALETWALENTRVPKTKRNMIWHQKKCKCWVCNITALRILANMPTPARGFLPRATILTAIEEKEKQGINDRSWKKRAC